MADLINLFSQLKYLEIKEKGLKNPHNLTHLLGVQNTKMKEELTLQKEISETWDFKKHFATFVLTK